MGLVPLLWLVAQRETRPVWWGIAGAFGISWVADWASHWTGTWFVSALYPVSQAALIGALLLQKPQALLFTGALVLVGLFGVLTHGTQTPEVLLHTVAWLSVVGIVWPLPLGRLRLALLGYFGLGWLAFLGYVLQPGWASWGLYQGTRALGIGLFCWAAHQPRLRLA